MLKVRSDRLDGDRAFDGIGESTTFDRQISESIRSAFWLPDVLVGEAHRIAYVAGERRVRARQLEQQG